MESPLFGGYDSLYSPALEELMQGQGIVDIVNSYVGVGLQSGLVGLFLFVGFFIAAAVGILRGMRNLPDRTSELFLLGQTLLATLIGVMVSIFTVSSITVVPAVSW